MSLTQQQKSTLIKVSGGVLVVDGVASMAYSSDQKPASNIGRLIRISIGAGLVIIG